MRARRLFDISPRLDDAVAVWPGDTPFSMEPILRIGADSVVNLSTLHISLHTGAHADAPWHFDPQGKTIEQLPLEPFLGPARLVTIPCRGALDPAQLEGLRPLPERILLRMNPGLGPGFPADFAWVGGPAAELLAESGVRLVGTDGPSVDRVDSKRLPAHLALGAGGVQILENLVFNDVPDGDYELIALPLKLAGADGSPVRAVLREML